MKNDKIQARCNFKLFWKLGSLSQEPGAYLLQVKSLTKASKPETRSTSSQNYKAQLK